ncbi:hypothetical protein QN219_01060 [Sinorhizobium sp. 7-81]|uniref:hypothetical protein n=1 Tax=Sinorhizobium sp. 8-89 TaxID=3049089 RepID=UPI0024C3655D|nr:hypothetical protein [Sinorhizobium sp. 8-89]MDK1488653.1 hypothetical protein [Sinorhizobium sp. 8-89]
MKHIITAALLILPAAPAMAIEITDDTPASAITVAKACREALSANVEAPKGNSPVIMCLPADISEAGPVDGDVPYVVLTK